MKAIATTLVHDTPDLVANMRWQIPNIRIIDNGSTPPVAESWLCLPKNVYWSGGFNAAVRKAIEEGVSWIWCCNSDIDGISIEMLNRLVQVAKDCGAVMVSPAIDDYPELFMQPKHSVWSVTYMDCVAPLIDVDWFLSVGGFDENLIGQGADIDLCYRTPKDVKTVVGDQIIQHKRCETSNRCGDFTMYDHEFVVPYLFKKHGDAILGYANIPMLRSRS